MATLVGLGISLVLERLRPLSLRLVWSGALIVAVAYGMPAQLQEITQRNQNAAQRVNEAAQAAKGTEPNAVFLSYALNDVLALYGHRSVSQLPTHRAVRSGNSAVPDVRIRGTIGRRSRSPAAGGDTGVLCIRQ